MLTEEKLDFIAAALQRQTTNVRNKKHEHIPEFIRPNFTSITAQESKTLTNNFT